MLTKALGSEASEFMVVYGVPMLEALQQKRNFYPVAITAVRNGLFFHVSDSVVAQFWFMVGLFGLSGSLILLGLVLRLIYQGPFWLLHRVDSRTVIPNIWIHYSFWAFFYTCLSIFELITAIKCVSGPQYPPWHVAVQGLLPVVLFLGQYTEGWGLVCGHFIRKYGTHHNDSFLVCAGFRMLPFLFPLVVVVPSITVFLLLERTVASMLSEASTLIASLERASTAWTPDGVLELSTVRQTISTLGTLMKSAQSYARMSKSGFTYVGVALSITLVAYATASVIEIDHLRSQTRDLRFRGELAKAVVFTPGRDARAPTEDGSAAWFLQADLVVWAVTNRLLTAVMVSLMLLVNAGLSFWFAVRPVALINDNHRFATIVLVSAWTNSILSTLTAVLILSRSVDGSNSAARRLVKLVPWFASILPPAVGLEKPTSKPKTYTIMNDQATMVELRSRISEGTSEKNQAGSRTVGEVFYPPPIPASPPHAATGGYANSAVNV
ncbi:BQ2448_3743 [Microbotryum intermedium]|uniref:BQ2448_3743 protein n=1 Tax=Microbotryum intermedium TaxID=269621 RepID=A0A238FFS6_9BASI|nr:BQ2448_3743 [Microbotryum intermedium]